MLRATAIHPWRTSSTQIQNSITDVLLSEDVHRIALDLYIHFLKAAWASLSVIPQQPNHAQLLDFRTAQKIINRNITDSPDPIIILASRNISKWIRAVIVPHIAVLKIASEIPAHLLNQLPLGLETPNKNRRFAGFPQSLATNIGRLSDTIRTVGLALTWQGLCPSTTVTTETEHQTNFILSNFPLQEEIIGKLGISKVIHELRALLYGERLAILPLDLQNATAATRWWILLTLVTAGKLAEENNSYFIPILISRIDIIPYPVKVNMKRIIFAALKHRHILCPAIPTITVSDSQAEQISAFVTSKWGKTGGTNPALLISRLLWAILDAHPSISHLAQDVKDITTMKTPPPIPQDRMKISKSIHLHNLPVLKHCPDAGLIDPSGGGGGFSLRCKACQPTNGSFCHDIHPQADHALFYLQNQLHRTEHSVSNRSPLQIAKSINILNSIIGSIVQQKYQDSRR